MYNAMRCQLFVALIVPLSDKCYENVINTVPATGMASDVFSAGKYINVFIVYTHPGPCPLSSYDFFWKLPPIKANAPHGAHPPLKNEAPPPSEKHPSPSIEI